MADNVELDAGSGGAVVAADDISSVWYPIQKLAFGPLNTATLVTASVGLPADIVGAGLTALQLIDNPVHVLGTATYAEGVNSGFLIGAVRNDALEALVDTDNEIAPLQVDQFGALWVENSPNIVDAGNSSTSLLNSGITFTGTGVEILEHAAVTIQIDASHDSAVDGMRFEFSTDNSNWDSSHLFTYTAADGSRNFQFATQARYFRVVYVNGGTNQTHFRLQTILHHTEVSTSIHRVVDNTDPDRSATLVKAAIIAQAAGSGDFVPVQSSAAGNLKVSVEEFSDGVDVGNGVVDTETLRVTIASDTTGVLSVDDNGQSLTVDSGAAFPVQEDGAALTALELIDDVVYNEDVGAANADPGLAVYLVRDDALAANAGVNADGDYMPFRANNDGALWVQPTVGNLGGCKMFNDIDLDEADIDVATGPCTVYGIHVINTTAGLLHLKLFNTNSVTMGVTNADASLGIPGNADSDGAGFVLPIPVAGLAFTSALTVAVTGASALDDNTDPGAGAAIATILYQD